MRGLQWLVVVFIVSGCGQFRSSSARWPATIVNLDSLPSAQRGEVKEALDDMNDYLRRTLVDTTASTDAFLVRLEIRNPWSEAPTRAGYATVDDESCLVQFSTEIFTEARKAFVKPVVWHELGHCTGLSHDPRPGEIMYKASIAFDQYTPEAIERFFQQVRQNVGL